MKPIRRWPYLTLPMRHGVWVPIYAFEHHRFRAGLWMYLKDCLARVRS